MDRERQVGEEVRCQFGLDSLGLGYVGVGFELGGLGFGFGGVEGGLKLY